MDSTLPQNQVNLSESSPFDAAQAAVPDKLVQPDPDTADRKDADLLDYVALICSGLDPADAYAVLGPHSALTRQEVEDRWGMICRERGARQ